MGLPSPDAHTALRAARGRVPGPVSLVPATRLLPHHDRRDPTSARRHPTARGPRGLPASGKGAPVALTTFQRDVCRLLSRQPGSQRRELRRRSGGAERAPPCASAVARTSTSSTTPGRLWPRPGAPIAARSRMLGSGVGGRTSATSRRFVGRTLSALAHASATGPHTRTPLVAAPGSSGSSARRRNRKMADLAERPRMIVIGHSQAS